MMFEPEFNIAKNSGNARNGSENRISLYLQLTKKNAYQVNIKNKSQGSFLDLNLNKRVGEIKQGHIETLVENYLVSDEDLNNKYEITIFFADVNGELYFQTVTGELDCPDISPPMYNKITTRPTFTRYL